MNLLNPYRFSASLHELNDSFNNRTLTGSWGNTETDGRPWTVSPSQYFDVNNGWGRHTRTSNAYQSAYLAVAPGEVSSFFGQFDISANRRQSGAMHYVWLYDLDTVSTITFIRLSYLMRVQKRLDGGSTIVIAETNIPSSLYNAWENVEAYVKNDGSYRFEINGTYLLSGLDTDLVTIVGRMANANTRIYQSFFQNSDIDTWRWRSEKQMGWV